MMLAADFVCKAAFGLYCTKVTYSSITLFYGSSEIVMVDGKCDAVVY